MSDELEKALLKNREIKSLWRLKDRTMDILSGCLLIHEKARLKKLTSTC